MLCNAFTATPCLYRALTSKQTKIERHNKKKIRYSAGYIIHVIILKEKLNSSLTQLQFNIQSIEDFETLGQIQDLTETTNRTVLRAFQIIFKYHTFDTVDLHIQNIPCSEHLILKMVSVAEE